MIAVLKTTGTLLLLFLLFPFNATIVIFSWLISWIIARSRPSPPVAQPKKILLTGGKMTKALQLARSFHAAGHQVYLIETHRYWLSGHRFSRAVKQFFTVPAPETDPDGYYQALQTIVQTHHIDVFIPVSSPVASYHDAIAGKWLAAHCEVLHCAPEVVQLLDDKFAFCQKARDIGLSAPKVVRIVDPQQILNFDFVADGGQYILKSIRYNSVLRLDLTRLPCAHLAEYVQTLPISPENPWVMQQFIEGQEYCTHSTVRNGVIQLHCCAKSSPFQVNYEPVEQPAIQAWVATFVAALHLTGQISFDFIQTPDGTVYPIECNPRTHSAITMFYNHPGLAAAYLQAAPSAATPMTPRSDGKPTYWLYHELWRLTEIRSWADLRAWMQKVTQGKEALYQFNDPLPFLMVPHWQITQLLLNSLWQGKDWIRIDFNIGKLVQLGGD